jgi:hypothetical protein
MNDFDGCLAERTDENLQQFRIHRHCEMVAQKSGVTPRISSPKCFANGQWSLINCHVRYLRFLMFKK